MVDESDGIHLHCQDCFFAFCNSHSNCKVVHCYLNCGLSFHQCKMKEHAVLCKMCMIPCPNAVSGCPVKIVRQETAKHLEVCPASVVHCAMEWNRYPIYSRDKYALSNVYVSSRDCIEQVREHWIPFPQPNPPKIKGDLDVELALYDQKRLEIERRKRMKIGKWKTDQIYNRSRIDPERINTLQELFSGSTYYPQLESLSIQDENQNDQVDSQNDILCCFEQNCIHRGESYCLASNDQKLNITSNKDCLKIQSPLNNGDVKCNDCIGHAINDGLTLSGELNANDTENHLLKNISCIGTKIDNDLESIVPQVECSNALKEDVATSDKQSTIPPIPERCKEYVKSPYFSKQLGLNIIIETLPKFQRQHPMYHLACSQDFRRDQYCDHFQNVHADIHGGLNGWMQERCPLAQYGCTYIRHRLNPNKDGFVVFNHDLGAFGVVPHSNESYLTESDNMSHNENINIKDNYEDEILRDRGKEMGNVQRRKCCAHWKSEHKCMKQVKGNESITSNEESAFLSLPLELIDTITEFIDSFSLNNLSRTCKTMREVCRNLLLKRGIVVFEWERRSYDNGSAGWKVARQRWFFSTSFSFVRQWHFTNEPHLGDHLLTCPFFDRREVQQRFHCPTLNVEELKLNSVAGIELFRL